MNIELRDVSTILPYAKNAKQHPKKQVKQIAASIKSFGFNQPVVVDKDGVLIVGHGRVEAAKLLGLIKIPVLEVDLTEEQARAYRLADNKLNESDWDMELVVEELKGLSKDMFLLTGFDEDLLIEIDPEADEAPAVPGLAQSALGDVYELGEHRVLCGSATELEDVLKVMDLKDIADLVFTDPPYNVDYVGKTKDALKIENDAFKDGAAFLDFLRDAFTNVASVTKPGGAAYVCHADSEGLNFRLAFKEAGFLLKQCIIWNKDSMVMGRQDYHWKHEPILEGIKDDGKEHEPVLYGWKDGGPHEFFGGRKQTTVWDIDRPTRSSEHPTMKPLALCARAIQNSSERGGIVLDVFGGSGSTLIACEITARRCRMIELDPRYVDVIVSRWVERTGISKIKKNGKDFVWTSAIVTTQN